MTYNEQTGLCENIECLDGWEWDEQQQACCRPLTEDPTVLIERDSGMGSEDGDEDIGNIQNTGTTIQPYVFDNKRKKIEGSALADLMDADGRIPLFSSAITSTHRDVTNDSRNNVWFEINKTTLGLK